ncbi:hypothetical protein CRG98_028036 [Punica granatum]|uniref:Uncharacterized protein n=1 Tax=Punica granatum TaxID=22663 RepID=A0A2I0J5S6_PUNGR|nr:hypothetical protein CRG98_028036 [Punica granatum]
MDLRHLLGDRVKHQATWFVWHLVWTTFCTVTDGDLLLLSSFEHSWFGRCGASLDDFRCLENMACRVMGGILWDLPDQGYVDSTPFRGESRAWRVEESLLASENAEPLLGVAPRRSVAVLSWSSRHCPLTFA